MYIFAEPYHEDEIDAIQTGEYIQALRLAEERARREKAEKATSVASESPASESTTSVQSECSTSNEDTNATEGDQSEDEVSLQNFNFETPRDMLPMVLKCRNFINGIPISGPPNPSAEDKWELGYTFDIITLERGLKLYQMCQERRRKALDDEFREQLLGDSESAKKSKDWSDAFLAHLKDLSSRGKKWREEFEATFGTKEKIVWRDGAPPSNFGLMTWKASQDKNETSASGEGEA